MRIVCFFLDIIPPQEYLYIFESNSNVYSELKKLITAFVRDYQNISLQVAPVHMGECFQICDFDKKHLHIEVRYTRVPTQVSADPELAFVKGSVLVWVPDKYSTREHQAREAQEVLGSCAQILGGGLTQSM